MAKLDKQFIETVQALDKLRDENFDELFRGQFVTYSGCTLTKQYEKFQKAIDELEVYDDDVWVTSFPKSGTTWTQEMVWCICNDLDLERAQENLFTRFPFLDFSILFDGDEIEKEVGFSLDSIAMIRDLERPRFIKSHLPFNLLPKQIRNFEKRPKVIHVTRNPKDACLSYYYHHRLFHGYTGDLNTFCELFMAGQLMWSPAANTVKSYWDQRDEPNIYFIKYEDMKADLTIELQKMAHFLDKNLEVEQMDILKEHLSFKSMRENPAVNFDLLIMLAKARGVCKDDGVFMRKGEVGSAKLEFSPEMNKKMDEWVKKEYRKGDLNIY